MYYKVTNRNQFQVKNIPPKARHSKTSIRRGKHCLSLFDQFYMVSTMPALALCAIKHRTQKLGLRFVPRMPKRVDLK